VNVARYNYRSQFTEGFTDLMRDFERMLLEGREVQTSQVRTFEAAFANFLNVRHVRGVACGTDALTISLRALSIGRADEVVTQANTFHATVAAIRLAGATPVLVDADEETFELDPLQLRAAVTRRTKALLPVHLYGKPAPMEAVMAVAQQHGLAVVEDAAQAHGARYRGRYVGTMGAVGCFSFHSSKNLAAAGDGGAVVTNDPALAESLRIGRELGQIEQNNHIAVGLNSKLDAFQARVLSLKLPRLSAWNEHRRRVAGWYRERLAGLPLRFQRIDADEEHVFHLFQVRTARRDDLLAHLKGRGIDVVVRYPTPIHLQPAFNDMGWRTGQFPVSERLARELLCLPIRADMSVEEVDSVAGCIRAFFTGRGLV
jgi:dTDP-4-amino-4,6-dideoxygalactose transaminase